MTAVKLEIQLGYNENDPRQAELVQHTMLRLEQEFNTYRAESLKLFLSESPEVVLASLLQDIDREFAQLKRETKLEFERLAEQQEARGIELEGDLVYAAHTAALSCMTWAEFVAFQEKHQRDETVYCRD